MNSDTLFGQINIVLLIICLGEGNDCLMNQLEGEVIMEPRMDCL